MIVLGFEGKLICSKLVKRWNQGLASYFIMRLGLTQCVIFLMFIRIRFANQYFFSNFLQMIIILAEVLMVEATAGRGLPLCGAIDTVERLFGKG